MNRFPPSVACHRSGGLPALLVLVGVLLAVVLVPSPVLAQNDQERAVLGIFGFSAAGGQGVRIAQVVPDSGAEQAGLRTGDLVVDIEGNSISSMEDLTRTIEGLEPGDQVTVTYERDGQSDSAEVELGSSDETRRAPFTIPERDRSESPSPERELPERTPRSSDQASPGDSGPNYYLPVIFFFGTLITAALVVLIVVLARRNPPAPGSNVWAGSSPAPPAGGSDPHEILRVRYAKGEVTRDEFLTMSSDLNGRAPEPPPEGKSE